MLMQMISRIRRRLQLERVLKGVALVAVLLLAGSILASLLLTQYNFSDDAIFWIRIVGSISILFLLFNYLLRPTLSPPSRRQIARFLEELLTGRFREQE